MATITIVRGMVARPAEVFDPVADPRKFARAISGVTNVARDRDDADDSEGHALEAAAGARAHAGDLRHGPERGGEGHRHGEGVLRVERGRSTRRSSSSWRVRD